MNGKLDKKDIILIITIVILIIVNLTVYLKKVLIPKQGNELSTDQSSTVVAK